MSSRCLARQAFSLVELLVVLAIIAILISLMIPAVQRVREVAARIRCANNLKQLGLALHNHHAVRGHLPPAYEAPEFEPGWAWATFLLPYLEQDNLFRTLNPPTNKFGGGTNPALPSPPTQTVLSLFRCPAAASPELNDMRLNHALANYRAVAGPITHPFFLENQDMGGVMFQNSKISFDMIADGTSNTLAVGECLYDEATGKRAAIWVGMTGLRDCSVWISDVMWWVDESAATINGPAPQAFSSRHPRGAQFVFCDGSVRIFREGGDPNIVRFLAGRNDGVVIDNDP